MTDLKRCIKDYSIRYDRKLKQLCTPLRDYLGLSIFSYYYIDSAGNFGILSTYPEQLEFYCEEKLFLTEPYLRHPHFFRSGYVQVSAATDLCHQDISKNQYQLENLLLKLHRQGNHLEGFMFARKGREPIQSINYLPYLDLLNQFTSYFKKEAKSILDHLEHNPVQLQKAKGKAFLEPVANLPLTEQNLKEKAFLKSIFPLSKRELECLRLFREGNTAQATAAILGISQRTVEFYFNNIKHKLRCRSKLELLNLSQ